MGVLRDDADRRARRLDGDDEAEGLIPGTSLDARAMGAAVRVVRDDKFVEGRDRFLFMANDNNRVVDQHTGAFLLADEQLEGWRSVLEQRTEMLAARGCAHLVMVAPNNHSLYPEKMPAGVAMAPDRPVQQLISHLERAGSPVRIIYPLEEMLSAKRERLVASRVDSHWTDFGAFIAFRRLMEEAGRVVPIRTIGDRDVIFVDVLVSGDLGDKFDPPRRGRQPFGRMRYRTARLVYDNCVEGSGSLAVTHCAPAPAVTCLLLGDSYSYWLARYLAECFRRLVFAHAPTLDRALVATAQPDVAITIIAERFLVVVPDDERGRTMREREERKRSVDRVRPPLLHWTWPNLVSPGPVEAMRSKLAARANLRDIALIGLMAYAGLRPAEAAALRWSAIEDDAIVVEPLPRRRAAGAGPRRVPLWAPLAEDLAAWRQQSGGSGNKPVFQAPGKPWSLDLRTWRDEEYPRLAKEVGVENVRPSGLRHVYCSLLIDGGASIEDVATLIDEPPEEIDKAFGRLFDDPMRSEPDPPQEVIRVTRQVPSA